MFADRIALPSREESQSLEHHFLSAMERTSRSIQSTDHRSDHEDPRGELQREDLSQHSSPSGSSGGQKHISRTYGEEIGKSFG